MLENKVYLPNRNFKTANPRIPLKEWKLKARRDLSGMNNHIELTRIIRFLCPSSLGMDQYPDEPLSTASDMEGQ
jgi:hypothetical protein